MPLLILECAFHYIVLTLCLKRLASWLRWLLSNSGIMSEMRRKKKVVISWTFQQEAAQVVATYLHRRRLTCKLRILHFCRSLLVAFRTLNSWDEVSKNPPKISLLRSKIRRAIFRKVVILSKVCLSRKMSLFERFGKLLENKRSARWSYIQRKHDADLAGKNPNVYTWHIKSHSYLHMPYAYENRCHMNEGALCNSRSRNSERHISLAVVKGPVLKQSRARGSSVLQLQRSWAPALATQVNVFLNVVPAG